jgi:hypothetical protein
MYLRQIQKIVWYLTTDRWHKGIRVLTSVLLLSVSAPSPSISMLVSGLMTKTHLHNFSGTVTGYLTVSNTQLTDILKTAPHGLLGNKKSSLVLG